MPVTFDLFGTLVEHNPPDDPATAIARELRERGVDPPDDWADAYAEPHVDAPDGAEVPLHAHVARALDSRGVSVPNNAARRAVTAAFKPTVAARDGSRAAVERARDRGPVALLSNCSVPELARRSLLTADLRWRNDDRDPLFDAVVTSLSCGWRKPDPRAFEAVARQLDCDASDLTHIGDSAADAGIEAVNGRFIDVRETPLAALCR